MLESLSKRASLDKFMHACYGLSLPRKLWVMGYKGFMGYVVDFPAYQLGRWDFLWVMGGYGLREVWVIRVSTVDLDSNPVERKARGEFHLGRAECERKTLSVTTGPTQGLFGGRPDLVPRVKTYLEKSRTAHLWYT